MRPVSAVVIIKSPYSHLKYNILLDMLNTSNRVNPLLKKTVLFKVTLVYCFVLFI